MLVVEGVGADSVSASRDNDNYKGGSMTKQEAVLTVVHAAEDHIWSSPFSKELEEALVIVHVEIANGKLKLED